MGRRRRTASAYFSGGTPARAAASSMKSINLSICFRSIFLLIVALTFLPFSASIVILIVPIIVIRSVFAVRDHVLGRHVESVGPGQGDVMLRVNQHELAVVIDGATPPAAPLRV